MGDYIITDRTGRTGLLVLALRDIFDTIENVSEKKIWKKVIADVKYLYFLSVKKFSYIFYNEDFWEVLKIFVE